MDLPTLRGLVEGARGSGPAGPDVASVRDVAAPTGARLRVYEPREPVPGRAPVVYLHGGGWVLCDIEDFDGTCRAIANAWNAPVVSVGYRLAPEHPFPAALDDAWDTVGWTAREAASGGPVVLMGDSAGGNLAAVCARRARDRGVPAVAAQVLVYPMLDHRLDRASHVEHATAPGLSTADVAWYWDLYLADRPTRDHPDAAPLRVADPAGLPPAYLLLAERDPVRDEGRAYADRLAAAGVAVAAVVEPGASHGFFAPHADPRSAAALAAITAFLATTTEGVTS